MEWYQRCQQRQSDKDKAPQDGERDGEARSDPDNNASTAWSFIRRGQTGLSFLDMALLQQNSSPADAITTTPVLDIRGASYTGKTWLLITLAARFVVATRRDRVYFLDSSWDATPQKIAYVVRSTLLRQGIVGDTTTTTLRDCLSRIHMISTTVLGEWMASLELLRQTVCRQQTPTTLVLWDDCPLLHQNDHPQRTDVLRQWVRLIEQSSLAAVVTTSSSQRTVFDYDKIATHRVLLERQQQGGGGGYMATVFPGGTTPMPYTVSLSGILS